MNIISWSTKFIQVSSQNNLPAYIGLIGFYVINGEFPNKIPAFESTQKPGLNGLIGFYVTNGEFHNKSGVSN